MDQYKKKVIKYFKEKAADYDLVELQDYWRFSDELLWMKFKELLKGLPKNFVFIDAGGGTGRWTFKILKNFPYSTGFILDLSDEMLDVARQKGSDFITKRRLLLIKGDLTELKLSEFKIDQVNLCFNFHNVLGFTPDPKKAVKQMTKFIKKGGYLVSFVPNLYHLIYFNISNGKVKEANTAWLENKGRFTTKMPKINLFTPEKISEIYLRAGLEVTNLTGFPLTLYPGYLETQLRGSTKSLLTLLKRKKTFNSLLKIELNLIQNPEVASRGNNIYIVGRKE